jgi:hypothetical protein
MKIGIVPFYKALYDNKLFDIADCTTNNDNMLTPYYQIKTLFEKESVKFNTLDKYSEKDKIDAVLFFSLDYTVLKRYIKKNTTKLIYFAWEPEVVDNRHSEKGLRKLEPFFDAIMTWNDDLTDNKKYFKINYPYYFETLQTGCSEKDFNEKKLLVNISGNKSSRHPDELYSERLRVIDYYNDKQSKDFELYGSIWPSKYACAKGRCTCKSDIYKRFKFALCLENMHNVNGYITEKIFDCFTSGILPVYCGATNINSYIPDNCFINYRDFQNLDELDEFLKSMNHKKYMQYLAAIDAYLSSDGIKVFTPSCFVQNLKTAIDGNMKKEPKCIRSTLLKINSHKTINMVYKLFDRHILSKL